MTPTGGTRGPYPPNVDPARLRLLRRCAMLGALLVAAVIGLSAFMRLSASGLDCPTWPSCYGEALQRAQAGMAPATTPSEGVALARMAHRLLAMALLPLALLLAFAGLTVRPQPWRGRWHTLAALALIVFLAALGRATADARLPIVTIGNLLGGFVLFALFWRMAALATTTQPPVLRWRMWPLLALLALVIEITLGAMVSGGYAALSCLSLTDCANAWSQPLATLDPWREPRFTTLATPIHAEGALSHVLHRYAALICTVLLCAAALSLRRDGRTREALAMVALTALAVALGIASVTAGMPLFVVLLHNLASALLLAVTVNAVRGADAISR